jgi:hypothetical protein
MTPLKLQQRDDPLAVSEQPQAAGVPAADAAASPSTAPPRPKRPAATRRRRSPRPSNPETSTGRQQVGERHNYDDDRLEQTGWRLYESLLTRVRDQAQELTDAGIPTSAAALAAATLHSHLPDTVEEGAELMRVYRQASAGRPRARRRA